MKYLCLFFITLPLHAAISSLMVKESALKHHPTVLAAMENLKAAEHSVTGAHGAFDTKIVSEYKRQTKHPWNGTLHRTQIEKPLRFANSKVYVGVEQATNPNGKFSPIYHTGNPMGTGQFGNYQLYGLKVSLLKNLTIDPERAALKNAKFDTKIIRGEKKLTELDIEKLSQLAYWEWVTARRVHNAYSELLKNGETRNEYLIARNTKGDTAKILVTENEQYVASRKGSLQLATERLIRAEYALSLFYRDQDGFPLTPNSNEDFEDYPTPLSTLLENIDLKSDINELIKNRPDMKNLSWSVAKADVDLDLARQDLRPQVDVAGEYFERTYRHEGMPKDYLMVVAQVNIPIEWNLGRGNIAAASARKMVAQKHLAIGMQSYKVEIESLRRALFLQLEQVSQSEIEYTKAKELVAAENYKFKTGGGNLFLVNLREEAQARAEASFHEARLAFMNTYLSYNAMVSSGD